MSGRLTSASVPANHSSAKASKQQLTQDNGGDEDDDGGEIRCICNYTEDDGFTIQCENCMVWQHAVCVGIAQNNVPDKYLCEECSPRPFDRKRANEAQRRQAESANSRRREKSPKRKPNVGRPRKQLGVNSGSSAANSTSNSGPSGQTSTSGGVTGGSTGSLKQPLSPRDTDMSNGHYTTESSKKHKSGSQKQPFPAANTFSSHSPPLSSASVNSHHGHSTKQKSPGRAGTRPQVSAAQDEEEIELDSDSQDDSLESYHSEFSSVERNIVTTKAVQELFRQVIAQYRQAQVRRSLSMPPGVKLVDMNTEKTSTSSSIPKMDSPDLALTSYQAGVSVQVANVVSIERESLARPLKKPTVKHILPSKGRLSQAPQYGLFAEASVNVNHFLLEYMGEVSLKSTYKLDPINQYGLLETPKPFVLFHPHLDLVVDARRSGNDARFVRRSCKPNTEVRSIVVPGGQDPTVHLGLFAKAEIAKGDEITLGWEWESDHVAFQSMVLPPEKVKDLASRRNLKELQKSKYLVASTILALTDCACENRDTCVLHQMLKDGTSDLGARTNEILMSSKSSNKKGGADSLRQRYGGQRDHGDMYSDSKRIQEEHGSTDDDDDELSIAGNSPRSDHMSSSNIGHRKGSVSKSSDVSTKKQRLDVASSRNIKQEADNDSESDQKYSRHRKSLGKEGSRASTTKRNGTLGTGPGQEMSSREMKQALMLIKKMEDKAASNSNGRPRLKSDPNSDNATSLFGDDYMSARRKSGQLSNTSVRPKKKLSDVGIVPMDFRRIRPPKQVPELKRSSTEDDNISIEDSGVDSDGQLNDRANLIQVSNISQQNRQKTSRGSKRSRNDNEGDATSGFSSDSDGTSSIRSDGRAHKKMPYAAASRGKRIKDAKSKVNGQISKRAKKASDQFEGGFVSVVGSTSDEEEEARADRQMQRENNLPKKTIPVVSLKPSMLPCKKVWKMVYLKQRAIAEQEAREKADEIKRKADEVFELKIEDDKDIALAPALKAIAEVAVTLAPATGVSGESDTVLDSKHSETSHALASTLAPKSTAIVHKADVLNLFGDDVQPEIQAKDTLPAKPEIGDAPERIVTQASPTLVDSNEDTKSVSPILEPPKSLQKMSLESYQAQRKKSASPSRPLSEEQAVPTGELAPHSEATAVSEAAQNTHSSSEKAIPMVTMEEAVPLTEAPPVVVVPKVKLSLQEYQKQRIEAQRAPAVPAVVTEGTSTPKSEGSSVAIPEIPKLEDKIISEDTEMVDALPVKGASVVAPAHADNSGYFDIVPLAAPLSALSSKATAGVNSANTSPISSPAGLATSPNRVISAIDPVSPTRSSMANRTGAGAADETSRLSSSLQESRRSQNRSGGSSRSAEGRTPEHRSGEPARHNGPSAEGHGPLQSPARERQHSSYTNLSVNSYDSAAGGAYHHGGSNSSNINSANSGGGNGDVGYGEELSPSSGSYKRSTPTHLTSPTGPATSRDFYMDERTRHHSNSYGDDWQGGYPNDGGIVGPGGYRAGISRGNYGPSPRERERERDRDDRNMSRDRERSNPRWGGGGVANSGGGVDRERDRRDYYPGGNLGSGAGGSALFGGRPGGNGGLRSSDYYDDHANGMKDSRMHSPPMHPLGRNSNKSTGSGSYVDGPGNSNHLSNMGSSPGYERRGYGGGP